MKVGIGFLAGRTNVCHIINNYYKQLKQQLPDENSEITFYILYDLKYKNAKKEDFYNIKEEVYKSGCKVKHIGEEEIESKKQEVIKKYALTEEEANLFMGSGYARARNTIMYSALCDKVDYLLFWDDDEYPVACTKENDKIIWKKQYNLLEHLKHIDKAEVTMGLRCGYMSPTPYVEFNNEVREEDFKTYIEAVSNEAVSWDYIKKQMDETKGITYADKKILEENKAKILPNVGKENWLLRFRNMHKLNSLR